MEVPRNSILRISDDKTLQLIELYEQEECLWNTELPVYKNRAGRSAAAERIARKLAVDHFGPKHVVVKFKNLRNSYCQELKKIAHSATIGEDPVYKPKVFWFSKMDSFLRPHLQPTWEIDNIMPQKRTPEMIDPGPAEEIVQMTNPEDVLFIDSCTDDEGLPSVPPLRKRPKTSTSWRGSDEIDLKELLNCWKETSRRMEEATCRKDDSFDTFGKYVAGVLRSMPQRKAAELQPRIVSLLMEGQLESSEEPNGIVSQSDDTYGSCE